VSDSASLRNRRRALSALCILCALSLVVIQSRTGPSRAATALPAFVAATGLTLSLIALVIVWRKEHAAAEAESAARERQQLAMIQVQLKLLEKKKQAEREADAGG
jgi:hypothetical protein